MKMRIFKEVKTRVPRKKLMLLFEAIVSEESHSKNSGRINLVFTTNKGLRALNRQFRAVDGPTDVLSFELNDATDSDGTFGEIYISVPAAKRQARQYHKTLGDEFLLLACHGMLHLLGYDHVKTIDAKRMKDREDHFLRCARRE